jgi:hypothetical protein
MLPILTPRRSVTEGIGVEVGSGVGVDLGGMGVSVGGAEERVVGVDDTGADGTQEEKMNTKSNEAKRKRFIGNDNRARF